MTEKTREIENMVRILAQEDFWKYHIVPVIKYSKQLAKVLKADTEVVELAAILHDIGLLKCGNNNHELTGALEAEKILRASSYPEKTIAQVRHCIESHRARAVKPRAIEAKIISNADAMAHLDTLLVLFSIGMKNEGDFDKAFRWVYGKIERDWKEKLTLPAARKMMKEKYEAIRTVMDATKKYMG